MKLLLNYRSKDVDNPGATIFLIDPRMWTIRPNRTIFLIDPRIWTIRPNRTPQVWTVRPNTCIIYLISFQPGFDPETSGSDTMLKIKRLPVLPKAIAVRECATIFLIDPRTWTIRPNMNTSNIPSPYLKHSHTPNHGIFSCANSTLLGCSMWSLYESNKLQEDVITEPKKVQDKVLTWISLNQENISTDDPNLLATYEDWKALLVISLYAENSRKLRNSVEELSKDDREVVPLPPKVQEKMEEAQMAVTNDRLLKSYRTLMFRGLKEQHSYDNPRAKENKKKSKKEENQRAKETKNTLKKEKLKKGEEQQAPMAPESSQALVRKWHGRVPSFNREQINFSKGGPCPLGGGVSHFDG